MIPLAWPLLLSAVVFTIGARRRSGAAQRDHHLHVGRADAERRQSGVRRVLAHLNSLDGQVFVFFVMTVAAAEVAVGLAIIVNMFRLRESVFVDEINLLKG